MTEREMTAWMAERLGRWLDDNGVTASNLARDMGVGHTTVHGWVRGERTPQAWMLRCLCERTGMSADYLLGLVD